MTNTVGTGDLEQKALELLPWYVNGTLEGEERELVARQVLASLTCRKELERLRRLHQLIQRDDAEAAATDREFERLMARIHASDTQSQPAAASRGHGLGWLRFALAATVVATAATSLWWGTLTSSTPSHTYETLTNPGPVDPASVRLRVLFAPGVDGAGQRELLESFGLTAIGPPAEDGVVTVAFPAGADRHAIVNGLKQDPRIRLVTTPPGTSGP
jgi:hypothetical protein